MIPAFWIQYQHPSLWIGIGEILHFGSSIGWNLWIDIDWHRLGPLDRYWLEPLETCSIGCDLWKPVVLVVTFGNLWYRLRPLETCGISCDLWKPVVSIGIGWNLLNRCQLGPLETKPVVNFEKLH
ncbi:unnamed protein product [Rhizophagus irregularis]|nr:unnamed protein product [Rhizophagus irregularis]